jgi:hypothetical protein
MIIANITSWEGQDTSAEHYYCSYKEVDDLIDKLPSLYYSGPSSIMGNLERRFTSQEEVDYLNEKDGMGSYHLGSKINRFKEIKDIHDILLEMFKGKDMVTYYEQKIFKDMICILGGVVKDYTIFKDPFTSVPSSCFKDLLPEDMSSVKIKCYACSAFHEFEDVVSEDTYNGRDWIKFLKRREVDAPCCNRFELLWNVVL